MSTDKDNTGALRGSLRLTLRNANNRTSCSLADVGVFMFTEALHFGEIVVRSSRGKRRTYFANFILVAIADNLEQHFAQSGTVVGVGCEYERGAGCVGPWKRADLLVGGHGHQLLYNFVRVVV